MDARAGLGRVGNLGSMYFDATKQNYVILTNEVTIDNDFSVVFWVNFSQLVGSWHGVMGRIASSFINRVLMRPTFHLFFEINSINYGDGSLWDDWQDGVWYCFAVTRDSNNILRFYRNNILKKQITAPGQYYVGRFGTSGVYYLNGSMAKVNIYNRSINANEIKLLSQGLPISRSGLLGEWKMNEMSGTTAYDTSGNGNHGTIVGATYSTDKPF